MSESEDARGAASWRACIADPDGRILGPKGGGGSVLSVLLLECFCGCCSFARASREVARGNALMSGLTRSAGPRAGFEGF